MSEEEKKAKEYIKEFKNEVFEGVGNKSIMAKNIDILLNLIEKQQKEIEERDKKDNIQVVYGGRRFGTEGMVVKDYISKDRIREAIKNREIELYADNPENDFIPYDKVIDTLKELLEENTNEWFRWNGIRCYFVT